MLTCQRKNTTLAITCDLRRYSHRLPRTSALTIGTTLSMTMIGCRRQTDKKNPHQSVLPTVNIIPLKLLFFIFITNSLNAIGSQKIACLCLLDLSAAFDTIDHSILIYRLSSWFGFRGSVLNWFKSYICHLGLSVLSVTAPSLPLVSPHVVFLGVAVLGPLLFIMYTTVHNPTRYSHCISLSLNRHLYVDDKLTQLFLSFYH